MYSASGSPIAGVGSAKISVISRSNGCATLLQYTQMFLDPESSHYPQDLYFLCCQGVFLLTDKGLIPTKDYFWLI